MKTRLFSIYLFLSLLLAPLPQLTGGQAAVLPLSDFVNASSLIAVVEVSEVTQVDVATSEHHHTSVFVAQATVLQVLKTDIWPAPAPGERRIAIVGSTQPMTSAVWRPIEKKKYIAFLQPEQGHYRYTLKHALRPINEDNKVEWLERNKAGTYELLELDLDEAITRIRQLLPADPKAKAE